MNRLTSQCLHRNYEAKKLETSFLDLRVCWTSKTFQLLDSMHRNQNIGVQHDRHFVLLCRSVLIWWVVFKVVNINYKSFYLVVGRPPHDTEPPLI